ncbi:MAG: hypothetical protein ACRDE5_03640 [Ginsengibacter sp.]
MDAFVLDPEVSQSLEDWVYEAIKVDPSMKAEAEIFDEISKLNTIPGIKEFCYYKNVKLNVDEFIKEAEKTYAEDEKVVAREDVDEDPTPKTKN